MPALLYRSAFPPLRVFVAAVVAAVLGLAPPSAPAAPHAPAADDPPASSRAVLTPEYGENGMVVAARREAARAGVEMLRKGGNAVDAAVATGFALAVAYPYAGNLGGGGFMVIRMPDGRVTTIDHREDAPSGATQEVYLDDQGNAARERSRRGHLASGVPGTVAGLLKALDEYGTLDRATVMAPAIRLARRGIVLSHLQAERFNEAYDDFAGFPATKKYFTKGDSTRRYRPGETFVQADLAATLKRIRDRGRAGFYQGETARLIAEQFREGGGLITREDLRSYRAVERDPVTAYYRGYQVHSMGPPSSGGVAIAQLLNAAEMRDIEAMGYNSSRTVHYLGEAMRRVFADRAKWLGDPDHVEVPTAGLVEKSYMRGRMASFDSTRVTPSDSVAAGEPALAGESMETTHYSVADSSGMAVSVTTTINSGYGSKVVVDGAGFFMNNEMNDFVLKPGVPNQFGLSGTERNLVAPGRRMVSSMAPAIVEDPEGRLHLVVGAPGGSTIITTVFQVILNVIDHGMDVEQAVTAGRVHHQWRPEALSYEEFALSRDAVANLRERGWTVTKGVFGDIYRWGRANAIRVRRPSDRPDVPRVFYGASDPRRDGVAEGL
jgi:gamma-glutamyltranspeptidase/glutathione hydrolase